MKASQILFIEQGLPALWQKEIPARGYLGLVIWGAPEKSTALQKLFPTAKTVAQFSDTEKKHWFSRYFRLGVANPLSSSLASALGISETQIRADLLIQSDQAIPEALFKKLYTFWREPAIEEAKCLSLNDWVSTWETKPALPARRDDSLDTPQPEDIGLEFETKEWQVLSAQAQKQGRAWNRAELELFAQTWSEHCKHKIFNSTVESPGTLFAQTKSLFKTHIRKPSLEVVAARPERYLSLFHDNAGVLALDNEDGSPSEWALALKMETHNSPSAIAPYGGASTGVVGVHRDILGTGLGALPVANWDVLCFESPEHASPRPATALPPDLIRSGVIKGIEDGGNQSGIPTVQGSVVFDPAYAVKPLVFAGCAGILPKNLVDKKAQAGDKLYCLGGATGADGLRGAVMSSRDIRSDDFQGSIVQVANAFVQRRLTDFLMVARDRGLISSVTDNGAGGLASSCGEMAQSTNGAHIDLSHLRLKFEGLHGWERLVSESQERMTVATRQVEAFENLAHEFGIEFDRLGELTNSGRFVVRYQEKDLVNIALSFLHEACPDLELKSDWTLAQENAALKAERKNFASRDIQLKTDFLRMLESFHLCSREGLVRRFDHEVQGRTLRKPFGGLTQESPQDGSFLEVYEGGASLGFTLAHGLAPQRKNIEENVLHSFDEALRSAVLCGTRLDTAGLLDNFSWADPIRHPRRLWRLVRACEILSELSRVFAIPFVSGKDSMKNNSKDFAALETLVVSVGASTHPRDALPAGFFSRANDVLLHLPPLCATLQDSAFERVAGGRAAQDSQNTFVQDSVQAQQNEIREVAQKLKSRYETISGLIARSRLRSAKDISEGGLIMALFEMCLGRNLGAVLEFHSEKQGAELLREGLGGIVMALDPHFAAEVTAALPEARRIGVVYKPFSLRFENEEWDLAPLRQAYLQKTKAGFWS